MTSVNTRNVAMAEGFKRVTISLKDETDRGSVVLAAAWLDESLTKIITKFFKPVSANNENLLRPGQPLGDFGTKIKLSDRLRLITPDLISSLTLCRRLRNQFAHLSSDLSFNTPDVKDRVNELFRLNDDLIIVMGETLQNAGMTIKLGSTEKLTVADMHETFGTKQLFHYTCGFINAALAVIEYDIQPSEAQFSTESDSAEVKSTD
jgi:DNA-binding MltR family transcriptional regulator